MKRHDRPEPDKDGVETAVDPSQPTWVFDREAIRRVDRAAIEEYGIPGIVLMENAARGLAREALDMLEHMGGDAARVLIFCGSGNNGGDGYALARELHNAGIEVAVVSLGLPRPQTDADTNRCVFQHLGLPEVQYSGLQEFDEHFKADLIVDAIFGTGLDRPVSDESAAVIRWINDSGRPVLAVDVPSGLDCNSGHPVGGVTGLAVKATRTVTFVGLKCGFLGLEAQKHLGEVVVVDIGAPPELAQRFGVEAGVSHREAPDHAGTTEPHSPH